MMITKSAILKIGLSAIAFTMTCPAFAVTVDSSYGWAGGYEADKTVNGILGTSDMGMVVSPNSWVIYDFGTPTAVSKVRVTGVSYGGGSQTFNPTSGTLEFSNDKATWTSAIAYSAPKIQSGYGAVDYAECALPQAMNYRYARLTLPNPSGDARIGEIWFVASPQLAVWESNQDAYYGTNYPAWQTADGDIGTLGVNSGDPYGLGQPYMTYDMGKAAGVYGFTMTTKWSGNPTSGELWVSNDPVSGYSKVGDWTLPTLADNVMGTVDLGAANALEGRYVQLRGCNGMWTEFNLLTTTAVPEPGSMLALCSGFVGLAGLALRRKTK